MLKVTERSVLQLLRQSGELSNRVHHIENKIHKRQDHLKTIEKKYFGS
jgi:hypothetical protein